MNYLIFKIRIFPCQMCGSADAMETNKFSSFVSHSVIYIFQVLMNFTIDYTPDDTLLLMKLLPTIKLLT